MTTNEDQYDDEIVDNLDKHAAGMARVREIFLDLALRSLAGQVPPDLKKTISTNIGMLEDILKASGMSKGDLVELVRHAQARSEVKSEISSMSAQLADERATEGRC